MQTTRPWMVCLAALLLGGCALVWKPTDSSSTKGFKLAARIPLVVVTLGMSELVIAQETERESQWRAQEAKDARRAELTKEAERWKAAAVAATKESDRKLALQLFQAAREDLAALDGRRVTPAPGDSAALQEPAVSQPKD